MLGQVKFSEAISSIWPRWRSSSRPISSAISGSSSASPARRSCSMVSCATHHPRHRTRSRGPRPIGGSSTPAAALGTWARPRAYEFAHPLQRFGGGHGSFAQDDRLVDGEVDRCRRSPGQDAAVDEDGHAVAQLRGRLVEAAGIRPAVQVGARRPDRADAPDFSCSAGPSSSGTRTPMVSGRAPLSQG